MSWDAIIIGGGHNGLVCAAYLARAGKKVRCAGASWRSRRCCGHRGVSSRLPQLGGVIHCVAAATECDRRPAVACAWAAHHQSPGQQLPAIARRPLPAVGTGPHPGRSRQIFRAGMRSAFPAYEARLEMCRRRAPRMGPACTAGSGSWPGVGVPCPHCGRWAASAASWRCWIPSLRQETAGPVHAVGGRVPGPLVRERADQGPVRLRWHCRQLCKPVYTGQRLCPAAPCVRPMQWPEGCVGPCDRRHGRNQPGHRRRCTRCWRGTAGGRRRATRTG